MALHHQTARRTTHIDLIAIALGLALAVLVRYNIIPSIPF